MYIYIHYVVWSFFLSSFVLSSKDKTFPNILIVIADDLGIGDVGCYGNTTVRTPNIDRLSTEGATLDHHLSAESICTPSRAALLTSRYPQRYGLSAVSGVPPVVVHVSNQVSLPLDEITMGHAFKKAGYNTKLVGKWHLGGHCSLFGLQCPGPLMHGFDSFFGMLFSLVGELRGDAPFWIFNLEDQFYQILLGMFSCYMGLIGMLLFLRFYRSLAAITILGIIGFPIAWFIGTHYRLHTNGWWQVSDWVNQEFNGGIMNNSQLFLRRPPFEGPTALSQLFVGQSISFIRSKTYDEGEDAKPFFLIHSFGHVHTPMFTSDGNIGRSKCGRYCDNIEEMDDGVGEMMDAIRELKEKTGRDTIVYFVSDHGGHLEAIDDDGQRIGGYNKEFKGGKFQGASEGGIRVPGLVWYPEKISPGLHVEMPTSLLDAMPTLLEVAGLPTLDQLLPQAKELDGISFASELLNPSKRKMATRRVLIHHCRTSIHGLRLITETKVYKMHLFLHRWYENSTQCGWGENSICHCYGDDWVIDVRNNPILFELNSDPYEDNPLNNTSEEYISIIQELNTFLTDWNTNVSYPDSLFANKWNNIFRPWRQPFFASLK